MNDNLKPDLCTIDADLSIDGEHSTAGKTETIHEAVVQGFITPKKTSLILLVFKDCTKLSAQLTFFWGINELGGLLAKALSLKLPGNLVGMCLLLALLLLGVVKLKWIEFGGTLLTRHMAFLFIPITVGLLVFGDLFRTHGLGIFATLTVSASIGVVAAGMSVQFTQKLANRKI